MNKFMKSLNEIFHTYQPMIWMIVIVTALWSINLFTGLSGGFSNEDRGTFGDMFGAINALFSGLAFAGLIFTITLQRKDLGIQFRTLESQLKEMQEQSESSKETARQLKQQQQLSSFQLTQSTVSNLINIKNELIDKFEMKSYDDGVHATFLNGLSGIAFILSSAHYPNQEKKSMLLGNQFIKRYLDTVTYGLQFILDSEINESQKKILGDIFNLQTFDTEIFLIYWAFENKQHELALLHKFGFYERHKQLNNY